MITYLLNTLVDSIKTSLINKLGLDPSTEVDLDDFPQLIDDIPILDSVEELTVTQNGTYTGTDGVTYNPVNVNLPLGSKSVTANGTYTASDDSLQGYSSVTVDIDDTDLYRDTTDSTYESVKTLSNCGAFPMLSLTAGIEPIQEGSGDPSPTNIRPISGWSAVNVVVSPTTDAADGTTYTIQLGDTYYGATLDVVSGVLTVDRAELIYDGSSDENWAKVGSTSASAFAMCIDSPFVYMITDINQVKCNFLKTILSNTTWGNEDNWVSYTVVGGIAKLCTGIQSITEVEDWKTYLSSNNLQVVYELANPITYQLTPTQVKSLLGVNNIWADSGDVGDARYFKKVEL